MSSGKFFLAPQDSVISFRLLRGTLSWHDSCLSRVVGNNMNNLCLFLLLILSCSTTKYYNVADLQKELQQNAQQLTYIEQSVALDFNRKLKLYEKYSPRVKQSDFLFHELSWRIEEMESRKTSLLEIGARLKDANQSLLKGISGKKRISEREAIFEKIESFGDKAAQEAQDLYTAFDEYRSASANFTKIMLFSRSSLQVKSSKDI